MGLIIQTFLTRGRGLHGVGVFFIAERVSVKVSIITLSYTSPTIFLAILGNVSTIFLTLARAISVIALKKCITLRIFVGKRCALVVLFLSMSFSVYVKCMVI